jgi:F-type H+-transporting ATPase subunit delta
MASATRQSLTAAKAAIKPLLAKADINFAEEIFGIGAAVASSTQLRSILSDPSAEANAKSGALKAVFGKNVSATALDFVTTLVGLRWSTGQDLVSAFEQLAVFAVASIAADGKKLATVESELFAFKQAVDSDQDLQFALGDRKATDEAKLALVAALTKGKVTDEAALLIRRSVTGARRRRVALVLEQFGKQVSAFAERLVATVTVATPMSDAQLGRLETVLAKSYGQSLKLNVEVDPAILGGIKVQVAGEILDGSLASRLTAAKLQLA